MFVCPSPSRPMRWCLLSSYYKRSLLSKFDAQEYLGNKLLLWCIWCMAVAAGPVFSKSVLFHYAEPPITMWTEVCYLPPVTGPCRASFPRWYYNPYNKKCLKFTYGGCKGNMNNFRTKVDCKKHCMKRKGKTRARAAIWYETLRRRTSNFRKLSQG